MERRLTTAQLAAHLGLKPATVQLYARERDIPFDETPGGHRRFNLEEVQHALVVRKGARASAAERQTAAASFGPSRRARGAALVRAVRTSDADVALAATARADAVTPPDRSRSAAVALLSGALGVHLSAAAR